MDTWDEEKHNQNSITLALRPEADSLVCKRCMHSVNKYKFN